MIQGKDISKVTFYKLYRTSMHTKTHTYKASKKYNIVGVHHNYWDHVFHVHQQE